MKLYRTVFALLLMITMSSALSAQNDKVTKSIIAIGQTDNQAMNHLDVLTNRFGGRLIGSDAFLNAANWVASQFRKWGIDVRIDSCGTLPVGFNRGQWFGRMLSENGMTLHFATPSYTSGTKGVQRGPVIMEPKTQTDFDRMKGALKGSWVLVSGTNSGWPVDWSAKGDSMRARIIAENDSIGKRNREIIAENRRNPDKEPQKTLDYREEPALFYKQMREAGILGIIQSSPVPIRVLYDRKNVEKLTFETLPTVPDIKLDENQYKIIEQMVKERRYFQLEFDIRNFFKPGPVPYFNVIGTIRGTKYPDEYVMMGGHLDAFDVATGGVDDGSGATMTMEAARLIMAAGGKPKRTIVVCIWAGEEFGLWGSKSWVERNKGKLDKISYYFNRDGGPLCASSLTVPEAMYNDFLKVCEPLNSINPDFPFTLNKRTDPARTRPTRAGGSDHAYFQMNGVPAGGFGETDPKGYDFNYGEIWHTERDTYNKSIEEYQKQSAVVTAVVVWGLSNLDHLLSRQGFFADEPKKDK